MVLLKWWGWKRDLFGTDDGDEGSAVATANGNDNDDNVINEGEATQQCARGERGS